MADPQDKFNEYAEPPFNPLPKVVIVLAAVILGLEMLFTLGGRGIIGGPDAIGWRLAAIENWAFYDRVWDWMLANGRYPTEQMARFVTYPLIHVNFTHALFVVVFVLAMGKLVSEVFGAAAFVASFVPASLALLEPGIGFDAKKIATTAVEQADGSYLLNGQKSMVVFELPYRPKLSLCRSFARSD